jgi:hypothetical protein
VARSTERVVPRVSEAREGTAPPGTRSGEEEDVAGPSGRAGVVKMLSDYGAAVGGAAGAANGTASR